MGDEVQVSLEPILEVDNVTVRRNKTDVIKEVNLVIHQANLSVWLDPMVAENQPHAIRFGHSSACVGKHPNRWRISNRDSFRQDGVGFSAATHLPKNIRLTVREL